MVARDVVICDLRELLSNAMVGLLSLYKLQSMKRKTGLLILFQQEHMNVISQPTRATSGYRLVLLWPEKVYLCALVFKHCLNSEAHN